MIKRLISIFKTPFFNQLKNPKGYFHRLIWMGCISVCIPIILIGSLYYQFSMKNMEGKVKEKHKASLQLIKNSIDRDLLLIEQESLKLAYDPLISNSFSIPGFDRQYVYHTEILKKLGVEMQLYDFVGEVYYYNDSDAFVISNEYGYRLRDKFKYKIDIEQAMKMSRQTQWGYLPQSGGNDYISFARKLPLMSSEPPKGLLVFLIKKSVLQDELERHTSLVEGQEVAILDSQQNVLFFASRNSAVERLFKEDLYIKKILDSSKPADDFLWTDSKGESTFYTYIKTEFGRTYISMIPEREITKQVSWVGWITFITIFIFLGVGVTLTVFNSRRVYNPIHQLMVYGAKLGKINLTAHNGNEIAFIRECWNYLNSEVETLDKYVSTVRPALRERFLQELLEGNYVNTQLLYKDCEAHNIRISNNYVVMVVYIENLHREKHFLPDDKPIITFSVVNIMEELLNEDKELNGYIINKINGNTAALLEFGIGKSIEKIIASVQKYAETVNEAINTCLNLHACIGIGRVYSHIADAPVSYRDAMVALQHSLYREGESILALDRMENTTGLLAVSYPQDLEKQLINALDKGELLQVEHIFKEFITVVRMSHSINFVYQSYQILLSSIMSAFEREEGSTLGLFENNLFGQLRERQTASEIFGWFTETLFPLYIRLKKSNMNCAGRKAVKEICKYIKENITKEISLVACSEMVKMNPSYVSHIFKKEVGIPFLEYIMECKVGEAKELLLQTDLSVQMIAQTVGYSERNLNRIFKRYTKQTPGQFRSLNR